MRTGKTTRKWVEIVRRRKDKENAERLTGQLINQGYPAEYYQANVMGKIRYRVICGRFMNREDAEKYERKLVEETGMDVYATRIK